MKVRLLISMVGPGIDLSHGDIIDTNEDHARALVEAGQGELVVDAKPTRETATRRAPKIETPEDRG